MTTVGERRRRRRGVLESRPVPVGPVAAMPIMVMVTVVGVKVTVMTTTMRIDGDKNGRMASAWQGGGGDTQSTAKQGHARWDLVVARHPSGVGITPHSRPPETAAARNDYTIPRAATAEAVVTPVRAPDHAARPASLLAARSTIPPATTASHETRTAHSPSAATSTAIVPSQRQDSRKVADHLPEAVERAVSAAAKSTLRITVQHAGLCI